MRNTVFAVSLAFCASVHGQGFEPTVLVVEPSPVALNFQAPAPTPPEILFGYDWSFSGKQYLSFVYPTHNFKELTLGVVGAYEIGELGTANLDQTFWGVGAYYTRNFDPFWIAAGLNAYFPKAERPGDLTVSVKLGWRF